MQHLRNVGDAPDAILLEAPAPKEKGKAKEIVFGEKVRLLCLVVMVVGDSEGGTCE